MTNWQGAVSLPKCGDLIQVKKRKIRQFFPNVHYIEIDEILLVVDIDLTDTYLSSVYMIHDGKHVQLLRNEMMRMLQLDELIIVSR